MVQCVAFSQHISTLSRRGRTLTKIMRAPPAHLHRPQGCFEGLGINIVAQDARALAIGSHRSPKTLVGYRNSQLLTHCQGLAAQATTRRTRSSPTLFWVTWRPFISVCRGVSRYPATLLHNIHGPPKHRVLQTINARSCKPDGHLQVIDGLRVEHAFATRASGRHVSLGIQNQDDLFYMLKSDR